MHMVMANQLLTCKDEVVVVISNEKISIRRYKTQVGDCGGAKTWAFASGLSPTFY